MSRLRALILDWDGTIVDSMRDKFAWLKHCAENIFSQRFPYKEFNLSFVDDYNRYYSAKGIAGLYDMMGINLKQHEKQIWDAYTAWKAQAPILLFEGIKETIVEIYERSRPKKGRARGLRIALNTTNRMSVIENILTRSGISNYLDAVVTREMLPESESVKLTKPHVYSIEWCLDLLDANPDETLAVGDTRDDIIACRTLRRRNPDSQQSVKIAAVTWGYETRERLTAEKPEYLVDKPQELIQIIKQLDGID
ncbi:HAD family hydrolase [Candidatus Woesearchaeota archaeon]|nr:HAD family hydrolase [Candidatus Woesearchaeota archaeon]